MKNWLRNLFKRKRYVINFMCFDVPSIDDDGIPAGTNFGTIEKGFRSYKKAQKYLKEKIIPEDKASLEECYGFDDEECEPTVFFEVEPGTDGTIELNVYDKFDAELRNSTQYKVMEVEF